MSTLSVKGVVVVINDTQEFSKGFKKKTFVIKTEGDYPQSVIFEAIKDKIEILDGIKVGDIVEVYFNIRGNEHKENYYINLQSWKIEIIQDETQLSIDNSVNKDSKESAKDTPVLADDDADDLPF